MTDKQKHAIKLAIDTMDKHVSRYWNTSYGSRKTGITVGYGEAINILSDMLSNVDNHTCNCQHNSNSRDNEPCCRCDSKRNNADRIRNMSDEELAKFLDDIENYGISSQYVDAPCDYCYEKTECDKCWKKWLQSEAE